MPDPAFIVRVRIEDEIRWRVLSGREEYEAWHEAHGWSADDVVPGSIIVSCWPDGYRAVSLYVIEDGRKRMYANRPLARSLPEGIGVIEPAPRLD